MAAPSYTTDLTTIATGDLIVDAGTWDESTDAGWDTGGAMVDDQNLYYNNTECVSAQMTKISNGTGAAGPATIMYLHTAAFTIPADGAALIHHLWAAPPALNTIDNATRAGITILAGTTLGDFEGWDASGSDFVPAPKGGWTNYAINPAIGTPDHTVGTVTTINMIGVAVAALAQARGNPNACNAVRYGRCTSIYTLGDLANGYATFLGYGLVDAIITNKWSLLDPIEGGYKFQGLMSLGVTATAVDFRDANRVISIANTINVTPAFNAIEVHNAASNVEWTAINISALGTLSKGTFEVIDNATVNKDTCVFTDMGTFKYLSNSTIIGTTYRRCDAITQNGATFTSCVFTDHQASTGSPATLDAALLADNLTVITDCLFIGSLAGSPAGSGHGIEITTAAAVGSPTSFDLTGNIFENFGADETTDAAIYNNSGTQIILNILSGGTPTVRNGVGSSTIINNSVTLLVQSLTEGAAVKIVADETVGTITLGDVILETLADSNGEATTSLNYEGAFEPSGLDVITRCRSSGLPTAAIQDDNGTFTDETTAANSATPADMNLLPATPVVNEDRYLFGHPEKFNNMKIGINTAGTGGFTITWQYWSGGSPGGWTDLVDVIDDTNSFSVTGTNYVRFTMPGDWTTTTIAGLGPYYYIRAAFTAGTATQPLGTRCSLDVDKYLPFVQNGTVTSAGLTVTASWNRDTIATF